MIKNEFSPHKHSIGHMVLSLERHNAQGECVTSLAFAMTTADENEERNLILKEGYGFGVLWHTFRGCLEKKTEITEALEERRQAGLVATIRLEVTSEHFLRALDYIADFNQRRGYEQYGLFNEPRKGQGAGCSGFVMSVLEVCGLVTLEMELSWRRSLNVPKRWIGGPKTDRFISMRQLLFSKDAGIWSRNPNEASERIQFWDPDLIFAWVKSRAQTKALHYEMDSRAMPVSVEPIWHVIPQHSEIYHPTYAPREREDQLTAS